jgi:hypothetical protein
MTRLRYPSRSSSDSGARIAAAHAAPRSGRSEGLLRVVLAHCAVGHLEVRVKPDVSGRTRDLRSAPDEARQWIVGNGP